MELPVSCGIHIIPILYSWTPSHNDNPNYCSLNSCTFFYCKSYFLTGCHTCVLTKLPVIQLMISNTFLVRLMQQLFLSKHLVTKFYILCVISVKCTVWILKLLLNPMIILIIVSESTIECSSIILFVMVGRYTFLKFEKNNINSIF